MLLKLMLRESRLWQRLKKWGCADSGVTSIEYALIAALVAMVIIVAVSYTGTELKNTYDYIAQCVEDWSCE